MSSERHGPSEGPVEAVEKVLSSDAPAEVKIARLWPVASGAAALLFVVLLATVIFYRQADKPFPFELAWMNEMVTVRAPIWTIPALVLNQVGGGISSIVFVPLVTIGGLLIWRRPWAALYYVIAAVTSGVIVTVIKNLVGRPRPTAILVQPDFGSFPSGHSATAALIATTLAIIFWRRWVLIAGLVYTLLMMLGRTYLGAHWILDTVGGMLVGVGVGIILWAPFALRLYRERRRPHPPIWVKVAPPQIVRSRR
ncbi:phosphatase PAP2 family protein [Leifsonia sp. P73]|uniref:phosphatase PAP2 family protein n=1 Tax=Leifsonia sp. P73 TaxID=3423959 RepID=UPI003DA34AF8